MAVVSSGVPAVINGVQVGGTNFSEFPLGSGVPSGITQFGISDDTHDIMAILNDPVEGNYFSMDGSAGITTGFGYDAFFGKIDAGEILARIFCNFSGTGLFNFGGAASISGLKSPPEVGPDFTCWTGGMFRRSALDPEAGGVAVNTAGSSFNILELKDLQEPFQNGVWCWVRIRRVESGSLDNWTGTIWYGDIGDEPAGPDGTEINQVRHVSGFDAVGWAVAPNSDLAEQRIAFMSYSGDPTLESPPIPSEVVSGTPWVPSGNQLPISTTWVPSP